MEESDLKRADDELNAAIAIKDRQFSRQFDEAAARGDEAGQKAALDGYGRMVEILEDFLALLRF